MVRPQGFPANIPVLWQEERIVPCGQWYKQRLSVFLSGLPWSEGFHPFVIGWFTVPRWAVSPHKGHPMGLYDFLWLFPLPD